MFAEDWDKLTPDERFAARMDVWQTPDVEWASDDACAQYNERTQLFRDVIQLKKPARVPMRRGSDCSPASTPG